MLRDFEITSGNVRFPDGSQAKGYTRDAFEDTWNRYCPTPENTDQEGTVPIRPNRPFAGHTGDGSIPWDGSTVPTSQTVPALTCEGTVGTDWDGSPQTTKNPICIGCRQPLTHDDGTHTHPTCETA
ncbi:DUF3631 domain-containing protein [Kribbella qitaiheensis]|uniref:DUF3631 domain-containing protein n=1 Tax=Kribbella qitaiheensis TaxID=1544730 RepID=UPI002483588F|nr:DUF3631 domain-containing protein [Kribbella qitaiheensis]